MKHFIYQDGLTKMKFMSKFDFLPIKKTPWLFIVLILFFIVACDATEKRIKPNIILIFIDDMGYGDLSSFGNLAAKTPNVDKLAAEGIRFDQFYVNSPICSPSRVAISTGTYPQRWNITSYLAYRKVNAERGLANWLDPAAPMLARDLKKAGYGTWVGKEMLRKPLRLQTMALTNP